MKSLFKYLRAIATVNVDEDGSFSYNLGNLKTEEHLSVLAKLLCRKLAIHPQYGTSEPAVNAIVRSVNGVSK
jgi:hypothetical protein